MSDVGSRSAPFNPQVALCIDSHALDRFGGVLRHLVVGLVDQAVPLRLIGCDRRLTSLALGPVQTHVHKPLGWPFARRRMEEFLEALPAQAPDVVHALSAGTYRPAGEIAQAFDAELVYQVTSPLDIDAVARHSTEGVNRFICFTQPLASTLTDGLGVEAERVEMIRPGVVTSDAVNAFCDSTRVPTLLSFADLSRAGGAEALVEAAAILRARERNFALFLLGAGRSEWSIRRTIRDRGLSATVTLALPAGDITQVLLGGDILIQPACRRGFAAEILHAMGSGVAVITTPQPAADFLRPGETAVICEKATPKGLADAIDGLLVDPPEARRLAESAMDYARSHHSISTMSERTAQVYRTLAAGRATFSLPE